MLFSIVRGVRLNFSAYDLIIEIYLFPIIVPKLLDGVTIDYPLARTWFSMLFGQ